MLCYTNNLEFKRQHSYFKFFGYSLKPFKRFIIPKIYAYLKKKDIYLFFLVFIIFCIVCIHYFENIHVLICLWFIMNVYTFIKLKSLLNYVNLKNYIFFKSRDLTYLKKYKICFYRTNKFILFFYNINFLFLIISCCILLMYLMLTNFNFVNNAYIRFPFQEILKKLNTILMTQY